ncbi:stress response protein AzuC [Escherichia coli]|nr:stress response protein AzuC [Escherichia coli]
MTSRSRQAAYSNNYCKTFKDVPPGNMFR